MNELEKKVTFAAETLEAEVLDLHSIEARIAGYMQGVIFNSLQVGRCLVIARDAKLVPHGQWEEWVRYHTGMSERRAQRLMQAATIAPEGSSIASLPVSKIMALLPLPEDEREAMAAQAIDDNLTVKQLEARVASLQQEAASQRSRADSLQESCNQAHQRHREDMDKLRRNLQSQVSANGSLMDRNNELERRGRALEEQLDDLINNGTQTGISAEALAEIDRLKGEVAKANAEKDEAEAYAERQAELRQQAQRELMNQRIQEDHGDRAGYRPIDADAVQLAVNTFLGVVGVLPHMDNVQIAQIPRADRQRITQYAAMLQNWVEGVQDRLDGHYIVELEEVE